MKSFAALTTFLALLFAPVAVAASPATPVTSSTLKSRQEPTNYEIVGEREVYSRWRTVIQRQVRYPSGSIVDFDVSGGILQYICFGESLCQKLSHNLKHGCALLAIATFALQ